MSISESEEIRKKVDESWKEQVEKERVVHDQKSRTSFAESKPREAPSEAPSGDFSFFVSSLSMQALISLGELPNPMTHGTEENLEQARYLIDVLGMLREKTKGNLSAEEGKSLEDLLYELRMKYVLKREKK